jgi:hypothetical protein
MKRIKWMAIFLAGVLAGMAGLMIYQNGHQAENAPPPAVRALPENEALLATGCQALADLTAQWPLDRQVAQLHACNQQTADRMQAAAGPLQDRLKALLGRIPPADALVDGAGYRDLLLEIARLALNFRSAALLQQCLDQMNKLRGRHAALFDEPYQRLNQAYRLLRKSHLTVSSDTGIR